MVETPRLQAKLHSAKSSLATMSQQLQLLLRREITSELVTADFQAAFTFPTSGEPLDFQSRVGD
jgi:hypothetical protein